LVRPDDEKTTGLSRGQVPRLLERLNIADISLKYFLVASAFLEKDTSKSARKRA
jgi:hypothetical protein